MSKQSGFFLIWFIFIGLLSSPPASAQTPTRASAAPLTVTGQYRFRSEAFRNSLDVRQLPDRNIKFHLVALWVSHYNPENIHNGELQGVIKLENGVAVYQDENCRISMKFSRNNVVVTQAEEVGDCDFGANVIATGKYRKLSSKNPKFDF